MSKQKHNAVIFAHPDDETIFFAGLILNQRARPWTLICVTDGNADGEGNKRFEQLRQACKKLGVRKLHMLNLPDVYDHRLKQELLQKKLSDFSDFHNIYTHGPLGEYGHPHHQDVCYAVYSVFHKTNKIYSVAYNQFGEKRILLNRQQFIKKTQILSQIYFSETKRLIQFLPAHQCEIFSALSFSEVTALYNIFLKSDLKQYNGPNENSLHKKLSPNELKAFKWYWPYLDALKMATRKRPF